MSATQTQATVSPWGQLFLTPGSFTTLAALPNPLSLDLLQIYGEGGDVLLNITSLGVVQLAPVTSTTECLFGRFFSRLLASKSPTVAQLFADTFSQNNANQDIIQLRSQGGKGIYHVDYLGVAYSS